MTHHDTLENSDLNRTHVGRYELLFPLGRGGMGVVYLGRLTGPAGFEKLVAVKVIHPHLAEEKEFTQMFLDEARLAALVHHPNVAQILEVGAEDGLLFTVGEFVKGVQLGELSTRVYQSTGARIQHFVIAHFVRQLCRGLHAVHEQKGPYGEELGLVHRDVCPRNLLVSQQGYVKLIDFGIAWAKDRLSTTDAGILKGKVGYASPERISGEKFDRRCDIYAAGVVLYSLLLGRTPFPGNDLGERITKILSGQFSFPRHVDPSVDPDLERIVLIALAPKPQHRYETARQMADELGNYIAKTADACPEEMTRSLVSRHFEPELALWQRRIEQLRLRKSFPWPTSMGGQNGHIDWDNFPTEPYEPVSSPDDDLKNASNTRPLCPEK